MIRSSLALAAVALVALPAAAKPKASPPPMAAKRPVTDTYHGVAVVDDYRWLEDGADPEVKAWTDAQAAYAKAILDALPATEPLTRRLLQLDEGMPEEVYPYRIGAHWYASKKVPGKTFAVLLRLAGGPEDLAGARELFDPNALEPKGLVAPDFMDPSWDGKKLAVSLSRKGSEHGTLAVYDLDSGKKLPDEIPDVNKGTAGGDVAWLPDSSGFLYTRYPAKGERPDADLDFYQQVWFHKLGTKLADDRYVFGKELPKIAEISFTTSLDGSRVAALVRNGDGGEVGVWLQGKDGAWPRVAGFTDEVKGARFGVDGTLYLLSTQGAPMGKLLALEPGKSDLAAARVVVPEGAGKMTSFMATKSRLYVVSMVGGPSELRAHDLDGKGSERVPVPPVSTVYSTVRIDPASDEVLVGSSSYLEPWQVFRWAPGQAPRPSPLSVKSPYDMSAYEVERVMARSKDGTEVPLNLIHKKGLARDGKNPTLLTAYGGYGISQTPYFTEDRIAWLEQGGVFAIASLRGGAEFGEKWHEQGKLDRKQNVFDDFAGCARWLIDNKVTSPKKLAIEGGSNGGLLMGAALVQHPELYGAVVSWVGIYDMLRVELSSNGEFNITEFGSVKDPKQFAALRAYSPYHNVKDGVRYPPLLLITGDNDPRVEPMQSRKFYARLRAAGAKDVLLYTNPDAGHGIPDRVQRVRQDAYAWAFLMDRLGMSYRAVSPAASRPGTGSARPGSGAPRP